MGSACRGLLHTMNRVAGFRSAARKGYVLPYRGPGAGGPVKILAGPLPVLRTVRRRPILWLPPRPVAPAVGVPVATLSNGKGGSCPCFAPDPIGPPAGSPPGRRPCAWGTGHHVAHVRKMVSATPAAGAPSPQGPFREFPPLSKSGVRDKRPRGSVTILPPTRLRATCSHRQGESRSCAPWPARTPIAGTAPLTGGTPRGGPGSRRPRAPPWPRAPSVVPGAGAGAQRWGGVSRVSL